MKVAMQNMYNYKKPTNYYNQVKDVKKATEPAVRPVQPKNNSDDYLEHKILMAKPEELTLMLFDGILRFIKQAKLFNEQKNIERCGNALVRAQDIIDELNATLNMDYEVSLGLRELYVFMRTRLVEANIKKDNAIMDEVLDLATDLRDTWREAMEKARQDG
jgi:flagellar secretion chaperone FliS